MTGGARTWIGAAACGLLLVAACDNAGSDRVLGINATGTVTGAVFLDRNGNRIQDAGDTAMAGVRVELLGGATGAVVQSMITGTSGVFAFADQPVGDYRLRVDTTTVGDTVEVANVSLDTLTVVPNDTTVGTVRVSYPFFSLAQIRASAPGTRVFTQVVALSSLNSFGDTTVHVADTSGALRVTRVRLATIFVGDSVRLLGRRNSRDGQPTLDDVTVFPLSVGVLPTAEQITSAAARSADGGRLDAALVTVLNLTILDTATVLGNYRLTTDDGSGPVTVHLAQSIGFVTTALLPDSIIDATGVLVPNGSGSWVLKPRLVTDVIPH